MVKRLKQLVAVVMIFLLLLQLLGPNVMEVLAENTEPIFITENTEITSDSDTGYAIVGSGATITLTLASPCTINGDVRSDSMLSGTSKIIMASGSVITGSIIDGSSADTEISLNDSTVKGTVNVGSRATLTGSGKIGTLKVYGGSASFTGDTEIGNLTLESGTLSVASAMLTITDSLKNSTNQAGLLFTIKKDTVIDTSSALIVSYNGSTYDIAANSNGTVYDMLGNTVEVANIADSHITETSGNTTGAKYMKGDTVTFTYEAEDGYYFPENYSADSSAFTVDSGDAASLNVTRKSYSEIEVQYTVSDETEKEIKINLPGAAVRPEGTGTVTAADINYGGVVNPIITSTTNDVDSAVVQYKKQGAADTEYSDTVPSAVGDYTVRASFQEKDYYNGFEITDDFSIKYLQAPAPPYTISGTQGNNGFYTSDVKVLPLNDYSIADTLDGDYGSYLMYDATTTDKSIYLRKDSTGEKTDAIALEAIKIDKAAPVVNAKDGEVYYKDIVEITVQDSNLDTVTVDGKPVETGGTLKKLSLASDNGVSVYTIAATDKAGNSTTVKVTVAAEWTQTGSIPNGSAVRLVTGQSYKFGSGTWKVGGDNTNYNGDTTFYVKKSGTYTFTQQ